MYKVLIILLSCFLFLTPGLPAAGNDYVYAGSWGVRGAFNGCFKIPYDVAVGPEGAVFVADTGNNRVQIFSPEGVFIGTFGSAGTGDGEFLSPTTIAVADNGNIYVADRYRDDVQFFSKEKAFIGKWGGPGKGPGEFHGPADIAFGPLGTIFVVDYSNSRIQYFEPGGEYIGEWRYRESQFMICGSIAITADVIIYLLGIYGKIAYFNADYKFLGSWGKMGSGLGEFLYPNDVAVGPKGDVFVADNYNHRVQHFTAEGSFVSAWGNDGLGPGEFHYPAGIAVAADGTVYVADTGNCRVQYFRPVAPADK